MKERNQYLGLKGWMLLWIILDLCTILPNSVSACNVPNCNPSSQCIGNTCYGCNDGYFLQSGSCMPCPDRCATCTSDKQCTKCKDTYWSKSDNVCSSDCSSNCLDSHCDDTTGYCYSCVKSKYGREYGCIFNCAYYCLDTHCDDVTSLCVSCKPEQYGTLCKENCNRCKDGQCNRTDCTYGCKDGYYQYYSESSRQSSCSTCSLFKCLKCSNASVCTECEQGHYVRHGHYSNGRGYGLCSVCSSTCLFCSNTEQCHEDCITHCNGSVNRGTFKPPYETKSNQNTTPSIPPSSNTSNDPHTRTHKPIDSVKSKESTIIEDCQYLNDELNSCKQQIKTLSESEEHYQLTFGHGLALGIGCSVVLFGLGLGIAFCFRRKTQINRHTSENSEGNNKYHTTNMTDMISERSQLNNEETNDIYTAIDASDEYDYPDVQNK